MPIMDGFEASKRIRELREIDQQSLKIYAVTANSNSTFKIKCRLSGMDQLLSKPVSSELLEQILKASELI